MFHAIAKNTSCTTYTLTLTGTVGFGNFSVSKATGGNGATTDAVATPFTFTVDANPQVGPNLTTTVTGDLIIAAANCAASSNGWGAGTGYTQLDTTHVSNAWLTEFQVVGAPGTYNATFTNSQTCVQGTSIGNLVTVAYKTGTLGSGGGFPLVVKYRATSRFRIPWDDRKKILEIVRT